MKVVKAGATVTVADFRGLRKLKVATGNRFAGGTVLYDGGDVCRPRRRALRGPASAASGNRVIETAPPSGAQGNRVVGEVVGYIPALHCRSRLSGLYWTS